MTFGLQPYLSHLGHMFSPVTREDGWPAALRIGSPVGASCRSEHLTQSWADVHAWADVLKSLLFSLGLRDDTFLALFVGLIQTRSQQWGTSSPFKPVSAVSDPQSSSCFGPCSYAWAASHYCDVSHSTSLPALTPGAGRYHCLGRDWDLAMEHNRGQRQETAAVSTAVVVG